jgi:hypothetical protein
MLIPPLNNNIADLIDQSHEKRDNKPRPHMGVSMIGHTCDRWLWLSFRWAVQPDFPGRILRLFRRGHMEEAQIVSDLRAIGMDIRHQSAAQEGVDFGSHVSGSIDAIIEAGVPEAPTKTHIAEFKTHSLKSFNDLEKNGVEKSKPIHYAQMQAYMLGKKIDRALYYAVCKDDDRIYTERVRLDKDFAEKLVARAQRIALADRMPEPISTDPSWYVCKFCDAYSFCHETKITKHVNCRTCAHSTAKADSTWRCEKHDADGIPVDFQRAGCESHVLHPDLVPWQQKDSFDEWIGIYVIDGVDVWNGTPSAYVFTSEEILKYRDLIKDPPIGLMKIRKAFPGATITDVRDATS